MTSEAQEAPEGRRAKRRCARNRFTAGSMPSAIHYVGYVEDDETPEMIMAKFAELERIQAAAAAAKAAQGQQGAAAAAGQQQQQQQQQQQEQRGPGHQDGEEGLQLGGAGGDPQQPAAAAQQQQQQQQQQVAGGSEEGGLTEEQLLEVFKQTSMFNVRTALEGNEVLLGIDDYLEAAAERYGDDEDMSDDEDLLRAFWSDEDEVALSGSDEEGGRRRRNRGGARMQRQGSGRGPGLPRSASGLQARHNVITAFNPITQALVRRRVRAEGGSRDDIYQLRVPPAPIPVAWGRTVAPYVPAHLRSQRAMAVPVPPALLKAMREGGRGMDIAAMEASTYREEASVPDTDWAGLLTARSSSGGGSSSSSGGGGSAFQAVLINTGWECEGRGDAAVQRLARLPMRRLVPRGFVFIWVPKQHVQAVCRQMRAWGYCYIENLTWVLLRPNNSVLALPYRYANTSHLTLYMFRREGEGKDIELRHQRNPDVTFDCLATLPGGGTAVPEEAFVALETLLPTGKGAFLELWAPQGVRRPGWTHVVEAAAAAAPGVQQGSVAAAPSTAVRSYSSQTDGEGCPHHAAAHAYLDSHRAHDTPTYRVAPDGRVQVARAAARAGVRQQLWSAQHRAAAGPAGPAAAALHDLSARFGVEDQAAFVRAVHKLAVERQHALLDYAGGVAELLKGMGIGVELVGRMLQHCPALFSFPAEERAEVLMSELMGPAVGKSAQAAAELFVRCPALANTRHVMPSIQLPAASQCSRNVRTLGAAGGDSGVAAAAAALEDDRQQQQDGLQPPAYSSEAGVGEAVGQQGEGSQPPKLRRYRPTPGAQRRREQQQLPPVEYDPAAAEAYFQQHPLVVARRVAKVGAYLMRFATALVTAQVDRAILGVRPPPGEEAPALVLQGLAAKMGPTFVKLAQTLSMRPDLIGESYSAALAELQDNVPPFDTATAYGIIESELGAPVSALFSRITPLPIASASLGQVYRATLASDGTDVAVKVQRPGVEATIALDVYMLRQMIGVAQKAAGISRDLRVLADEVGRSLYEELDFRIEARNAAEFRRAHAHMAFIAVPGTIWRYTTRRVLITEWVDGRSPSQLLADAEAPLAALPDGDSDPAAVAAAQQAREARRAARRQVLSLVRMGVQCSLAQLLVTGVMHGDPHSGNLLLRKADGRLCYLDFGLVVRVTPEHRQAMMSALVHLGLGEWEKLVGDMQALDLLRAGTDKDQLAVDLQREFTAVMAEAEAEAQSSFDIEGSMGGGGASASVLPLLSLTTTALSFSTLTRVLFRIAFQYKFLLPSYFPLVLRAVASLEGVALSVDKNFKLISAGMPVVLNQLLSDRRPAAQALLRELLLNADGTLRSDATTQQIMQVWLAAADQAAAAAAGDAVGATAPAAGRGGSSLVASLSMGPAEAGEAGAGAPGDGGLDLAALLLDGRNAPLRRIAMDANPAKTISSMPPAMRQQLKEILVEVLSSGGAASRLMDPSPASRAQRKRLFLLFRSSLIKVLKSPPASILSLLAFTASVMVAVARARLAGMWQHLMHQLTNFAQRKQKIAAVPA
ncbi:putative aarF domain-containing kinase chloroplastic [Chlorella sorokiniana]|uniref:AarF domain-containing kinase chloroplastic n=1 Tax=Chlorella sorokiniana TaxID=3076 RepID=A0A2P6TNV9_CHLSO|nr:putative aarF domain-containing kinase chloroplastic [Chlorella sorokiniana]|eukprot:PRW51014.1 putative aarF domain-containing kinase chloroplastic [Chlorella sorokiniana]